MQLRNILNQKLFPDTLRATDTLPRSSPFPILIYTHAEPPRASLLAPPDHETVTRFEDVQRASDAREGHCAYKDGDVLGQAEGQEKRPL